MRWVPWLLGIVGVVQYGIIAWREPAGYVTTDMAYLVMWLCIIGALLVCYIGSCGGGCCCGWDDGGCDCCGEGCECGDGDCCAPHEGHGEGDGNGNGHGHAH